MSGKKLASPETLLLIRKLAADPGRARVFGTAKYDLMGSRLTKADVCNVICEWIDAGKPLMETVIHTIPELVGEPAYELKPTILDEVYYVKVTIQNDPGSGEMLLILSAHPDH